jgi:hypothetical protein
MYQIDFEEIVKNAWIAYDKSRTIMTIEDISAKVSTNHVYRLKFMDGGMMIAKLSYFGNYEHFKDDHQIIQVLSNNLPMPHDNFLAKSMMKGDKLFVHRFTNHLIDAWVVFYLPMRIKEKLPRILSEKDIINLGKEFAYFHKACFTIRNTLPQTSKTLEYDINEFKAYLNSVSGQLEFGSQASVILGHCDIFLNNYSHLDGGNLPRIPVFVDWNIGNFSLEKGRFYSRWDYDWFRVCTRIMDFYFISRVVSDVGDRTIFTYNIDPLMGERFILFLKTYHRIHPLVLNEILLIKEMYRFFLLNYVLRFGKYFFSSTFAFKLQEEVLQTHLHQVDHFDAENIIKSLDL